MKTFLGNNQERNHMTNEEIKVKIDQAIAEVRPMLQRDGGDIQLIEVVGKSAKVRLQGHCVGCPGAAMTLKFGVERRIRELVPEFEQLITVN
jgi:Fe-S cluster biogenesis protein NfuA